MKTKTVPHIVLLALGLAGLAGCRSAHEPGSSSHASVQIKGQPLPKIQQTIAEVFREEGYALTAATTQDMIFDRPGSRREAAKWGGWMGGGVTMRVKVHLSPSVVDTYLVQADAYAVEDAHDPLFETENRNVLLNRRPYQKLLNKVEDRLK